ncbi:TPA: hypothetical protein ACXJGC_002841 [Burkholderia cenocepacia]
MTSSDYAAEWAVAVERTKRFGLEVPSHEVLLTHRYLGDTQLAEFPYVVQRGLGDLDFHDVVAQCMAIHFRLVPVIQEWLKCPVLFTLGWIDDGTQKGMFKFDDGFIASKLKNGHAGGTVNLHAWLTLPSMEVIDVALATTIAVLNKMPNGHGGVLAGSANSFNGIAYKPMLVGPDFLRKTGLLVEGAIYMLDDNERNG